MFAWSKGLLLATILISSFSNCSAMFLDFFKEQNSSTSWITKGFIITGVVAFAYQWYQIKNLKYQTLNLRGQLRALRKRINRIKYDNMYFKKRLCLIIFGIEDYPLIRRSYWPNDYSIQASRLRIRNVFADLRKYDLQEDEVVLGEIALNNTQFLNHEIEPL